MCSLSFHRHLWNMIVWQNLAGLDAVAAVISVLRRRRRRGHEQGHVEGEARFELRIRCFGVRLRFWAGTTYRPFASSVRTATALKSQE